jgi:hypothetical protein
MAELRYDVAISFAGEDRGGVAEELATSLLARKYRVFYDRFEQHALWGEDLGGYLPDVYSVQSRYCVIVVSANYAKKVWTRLEFRSAIAGAIFGGSQSAYVLPLILDDTKLSGLHSTVGYLDLRELDIRAVVDLLVQKIGPPMDGTEQDLGEICGIAETLAICRAHIRPNLNARRLREFGADLRRQIVFVRPRQAQQLVAGIIAELDLAERLRRDKSTQDSDTLVDSAVVRIEAAVHALADLAEQPSDAGSRKPRRKRRGVLAALAAGCVLTAAIGVWAVADGFDMAADDSSTPAGPASTSSKPAPKPRSSTSSAGSPVAPTVEASAVGGPAAPPPSSKSVVSTSNQPAPHNTPVAPQTVPYGSIVLAPTDGLDLDVGARGHQDDPGVDISPSADGSLINGMSHGKPKMAVVTSSAATGPGLCDTIPADAWRTPLTGLHGMRTGDRICVRTDRGNYGVLTLRTVPSSAAVDLDIDYIAWPR